MFGLKMGSYFVAFFLMVALSACGGGGGGDSTPVGNGGTGTGVQKYHLAAFPINQSYRWEYTSTGSSTYFLTSQNIGGQTLSPLLHPSGVKEYFYANNQSLIYKGVYFPSISVSGAGTFSTNIILNDEVILFSENWQKGQTFNYSGKGEVNISPTYGKRSIDYTGAVSYLGREKINTPYKEFDAHRLAIRLNYTTTIDGQKITIDQSMELWLADWYGIVARSENGYTYYLENIANMPDQITFNATAGTSLELDPVVVTVNGNNTNLANSNTVVEYDSAEVDWLSFSVDSSTGYLQVTPNIEGLAPGEYSATLLVTDSEGFTTPVVVTFVVEVPTLTTPESLDIDVNAQTTEEELSLEFEMAHTGELLDWTIQTDSPWVSAIAVSNSVESGAVASLQVNKAALESLTNGEHIAEVSVTYSGQYVEETTVTFPFEMSFQLPTIKSLFPYVVYENEDVTTKLFGENLLGAELTLDGSVISEKDNEQDTVLGFKVPQLALGEYEVRLSNNLNLERGTKNLVIRSRPQISTGVFPISGTPRAIEYDPERHVFYLVMGGSLVVLTNDGNSWTEQVLRSNAHTLTLTTDGEELLVTTTACEVVHYDANTLSVLETTSNSDCYVEDRGLIHAFDDGSMLVGDTNQWPNLWAYPSYESVSGPSIHSPLSILSRDRSRMIYAGQPTITGSRDMYFYDSSTKEFTKINSQDPDTHYVPDMIGISAHGERMVHRTYVYDQNLSFIGNLQGASVHSLDNAIVSNRGDKAILFSYSTTSLSIYDIAGESGPFLKQRDIPLSKTVLTSVGDMWLTDDDKTLLVFGLRYNGSSQPFSYNLVTINLDE
ncbi:DUF3108 domain-containing protein [Aliikangiella coralliicola]|uniref:DUF3108 domain-containing protein n=1 Tax=Aliikangiella coralliicola TaxID=2592383 RepID=A0A545UCJ2_9GAMM|nr:DUF3108 domain-containing protein [Aliikangiella coralliicola]TQV87191.1 DUF3108 domain-containing protein [Aliikangiella coralliicola]